MLALESIPLELMLVLLMLVRWTWWRRRWVAMLAVMLAVMEMEKSKSAAASEKTRKGTSEARRQEEEKEEQDEEEVGGGKLGWATSKERVLFTTSTAEVYLISLSYRDLQFEMMVLSGRACELELELGLGIWNSGRPVCGENEIRPRFNQAGGEKEEGHRRWKMASGLRWI